MVAAGKIFEDDHNVPWHGCLAHVLELVTGVFFKAPFVKVVLQAARKLIGHYTMSPQAEKLLFE